MNSSNPGKLVQSLIVFAAALLSLLFAAVAPAKEGATSFNLLGARVSDLVTGPGGALWYAGRSYEGTPHDEVGRVMPLTGEMTRFPLPQREERFLGIGGIAAGPSGDLWFTEPNFSRIGRIAPTGAITEIPSPLYRSEPKQIVVGPDGNIWFTDGYYRVDRYHVDTGAFEEFIIAGGADPTGIVAGPDGAIWFAERGMGHIGRISMSGEYTRYEIPGVSHPRQIVVGPDRNLWFTDEEAPRIGRITTEGRISLFPVPVKEGTDRLSSGPGELLWFSSGAEIGTISPSGQVALPECPSSSCSSTIADLAPGPDDDLWVATNGFLARFLPSVRVSIGRHPSRVRGRFLTIGLWCEGGVLDRPCEGALRLNGLVPRPGGPESDPMTLQLANSRFSIPGDSGRRITLRLRGRPLRLLAGRKRIKAWAYTTIPTDRDVPLPLTLRR